MEGSGMKPNSYKFIVSTNLDRMDRTSFVSIAPGIAVRADYCIRAMEDRIGKYDIRLHMGYSEEERRIVLRNCEIGTTRELKIRDIARLPIEQIIRSYHPPLWSYEITDSGTNIFGPLPDWEHDVLSSVDFPAEMGLTSLFGRSAQQRSRNKTFDGSLRYPSADSLTLADTHERARSRISFDEAPITHHRSRRNRITAIKNGKRLNAATIRADCV